MRNYSIILFLLISLFSCISPNQKEIGEVEGLISMIDEIEQSVLSVDTSRAFLVKRQLDDDMKRLDALDTIDKQTAIIIGEFYGGKKKIDRFYSNYNQYIKQITFSKKQLENLKQDLSNDLIAKEKFEEYYRAEQGAIMELNSMIHKSIDGIELYVKQLETDRDKINEMLDDLESKSTENE